MKSIAYLEDIHAEGVNSKPLYFAADVGNWNAVTTTPNDKPAMLSGLEFLLERLNDPKLVMNLDPYAASRLRFMLRRGVRQAFEAKRDWNVKGDAECGVSDESAYDRVKSTITSPENKLMLESIHFNYFPFEEAVVNASAVEEKSASNGAAVASA